MIKSKQMKALGCSYRNSHRKDLLVIANGSLLHSAALLPNYISFNKNAFVQSHL